MEAFISSTHNFASSIHPYSSTTNYITKSKFTSKRVQTVNCVATPPPSAHQPISPLIPPKQPPHVTSQPELFAALAACGHQLAVLKVYSKSCRSCARIERPFARLAQAKQNQLACFQICADDCQQFVQTLGVRAMPTFILYVDSKRVDHFANSNPSVLEEHIDDYL